MAKVSINIDNCKLYARKCMRINSKWIVMQDKCNIAITQIVL
mgnify:CR=1 FL=1